MSESKLKWEPYGSALFANQVTDGRKAEYFILNGVGYYKLDIDIHIVKNFRDLENAKAFAEKLEGLINETSKD